MGYWWAGYGFIWGGNVINWVYYGLTCGFIYGLSWENDGIVPGFWCEKEVKQMVMKTYEKFGGRSKIEFP